MTRIGRSLLIQPLDVEVGVAPDAVVMDESTGEEIVIQAEQIPAAIAALQQISGVSS